jgi:hypothetical protein
MRVGFQTQAGNEYKAIEVPNESASPVLVSVSQKKDDNMDKFLVWHIEGGLGKNVAATALIPAISKKYRSRKIVLVASYPEVFLNHPDIHRVYRAGLTPYFYEDYILGKDTLVFRHEPYFQTGHILKQKHVVQNWADLLGVDYDKQRPTLYFNMVQKQLLGIWDRPKPILLIQTNGGMFQGQKLNYAWTRDMPIDLALHIVNKFSNDYHIIQLTRQGATHLPGVEVVDYPMSNMELFSLVAASQKRILIDSSLQHAAAALGLSSVVFWVGTAPENFGYDIHTNIKALPPKGNVKLVDAYLFDYSFEGAFHECPYNEVSEMYDMNEVNKVLDNI